MTVSKGYELMTVRNRRHQHTSEAEKIFQNIMQHTKPQITISQLRLFSNGFISG